MSSAWIDRVAPSEHVPTGDQRVVMHGVTWDAFESFLSMRGDRLPRVAYLEGTLELISPSRDHERLRTYVAAVVAEYLDHLGIVYDGAGSWLLKHALEEAGLEPDGCYLLGDTKKSRPDLAIEVMWTSDGISKLDIYERLGVGEVWLWNDEAIVVHVLTDDGYETRERSARLPTFDFALALQMLKLPTLSEVRRQIRAHIASK